MRRKHPPEAVAHHEAAHAVILLRAGGGSALASIVPKTGEWHGISLPVDVDSFDEKAAAALLVSYYAGACAHRRIHSETGRTAGTADDYRAGRLLEEWGWEAREDQFRARAQALVDTHWLEITAVAAELLKHDVLDETEVEIIADEVAAGNDPTAAVTDYRTRRGEQLTSWRQQHKEAVAVSTGGRHE